MVEGRQSRKSSLVCPREPVPDWSRWSCAGGYSSAGLSNHATVHNPEPPPFSTWRELAVSRLNTPEFSHKRDGFSDKSSAMTPQDGAAAAVSSNGAVPRSGGGGGGPSACGGGSSSSKTAGRRLEIVAAAAAQVVSRDFEDSGGSGGDQGGSSPPPAGELNHATAVRGHLFFCDDGSI